MDERMMMQSPKCWLRKPTRAFLVVMRLDVMEIPLPLPSQSSCSCSWWHLRDTAHGDDEGLYGLYSYDQPLLLRLPLLCYSYAEGSKVSFWTRHLSSSCSSVRFPAHGATCARCLPSLMPLALRAFVLFESGDVSWMIGSDRDGIVRKSWPIWFYTLFVSGQG